MVAAFTTMPDLDSLDPAALKAIIVALKLQLLSNDNEIEHLKLLVAKLRRMQFGRRSEKVTRQIEQLELKLEELEASRTEEAVQAAIEPSAKADASPTKTPDRRRRPLPEHLPRKVHTHMPAEENCPDCGGTLKRLGEDVSEVLEYIPASFVVIRHVRPRMCCSGCDTILQAAAPGRPVERGLAGPGLLAHVLTAKFCDHLPLYRQSDIYARDGVDLERSTLAKWVGGSSALLAPLVEALRRYVMDAYKLHGDDTPVPVLAPGSGKTRTGRLWTYVRDDRPAGSLDAPAAWFAYSPDRRGEHPQKHLAKFKGILQADAFAGFDKLYQDGTIQEAPCMAHIRRKFYDLIEAHQSPTAIEAVERIAALCNRKRDSRTPSGSATTSTQPESKAAAGRDARLAKGVLGKTFAEVRHCRGDSLCACALESLGTVLRRWPHRNRQQHCRACFAYGCGRPSELSFCGIQRRRTTGRRNLFPGRIG